MEIARKIDSRDGGTKRHSQVVARYAELTARELDLPEDVVDDIRLAGLLHDVGKSAIPERILAKPGPLSDIEWLEMRRHPWIAVELLEDSGLDQIREWIYCHHERPDGSGYPRGLAGDEIPVEARILAVADAYEAMTNDRVYRPSIGKLPRVRGAARVRRRPVRRGRRRGVLARRRARRARRRWSRLEQGPRRGRTACRGE